MLGVFFLGENGKVIHEGVNVDENIMISTISDVLEGELYIRKEAQKCNIKASTLHHRIERKRNQKADRLSISSKYCSQVFSEE